MSNRLETGPVQCGDDWPGIFIRGDEAMHFAHALSRALFDTSEQLDPIQASVLRGLRDTLESCNVTAAGSNPTHIRLHKP